MNTIWKFQLTDDVTEIEAHIIKFLTVQLQNGQPCVWAIVDPERTPKKYKINIIGTGWESTNIDPSQYIGTIQTGSYVWHCFWENVVSYKTTNAPTFSMFSKQF